MISFLAPRPLYSACRRKAGVRPAAATGIPETLASKRIFFGHQSVGAEILAGVSEFAAGGRSLRILTTGEIPAVGGFLAHSCIGRNGDPCSKLAAFAARLETLDKGIEIAVFKFSHLDVAAGTDAESLFIAYRQAMNQLAGRHCHLRIVHCTAPLTLRQSGPRARIRRLFRRQVPGVEDNLARARFNDLLRRAFGAAVFDLAAIESTWPDGHREVVASGEAAGYALVPVYADKTGHLNALGRRTVAERFLTFLANMP